MVFDDYDDFYEPDPDFFPVQEERPPDEAQEDAQEKLTAFFDARKEGVFFSRQLEVQNEDDYFHWVTNRALRYLIDMDVIRSVDQKLSWGGSTKLIWHKGLRYHKRPASRVTKLIEEYSNPDRTAAVGERGELMTLDGFTKFGFVRAGRNTNEYRDRKWTFTMHDLDFIFEKDGQAYGVEVKNRLGYMDASEINVKMQMCQFLGIRPVFVVRMLPRPWIWQIRQAGGFALILKWQLYPPYFKDFARRIREELGLPVDSPRALYDATMQRFITWHNKRGHMLTKIRELKKNSHERNCNVLKCHAFEYAPMNT